MTSESLEGKRIAIYGATSKIASVTARKALAHGAEVVAFVRNEAKAEPLKQAGAEIVVGDITSREDVMKAVEGRNIDVTINFAAVFNQSPDASKSRAVNVDGERFVLDATEYFYIPRHIFISSIATYMEGPNAYRDTKLEAENLVRNSQVPEWFILRFANVLGTDDPNDLWNNPFITKDFLGKRIGFSVKLPFKRNALFPYLGVKTAAHATLAAISAQPNKTITILDGFDTLDNYLKEIARVNDIDLTLPIPDYIMIPALVAANRIARVLGKHFPLTPGPAKMLTKMPKFETETMCEELGIKPQSFAEVIRETEKTLKRRLSS